MPYKEGYGMKKATDLGLNKTKVWGSDKGLKGLPKPVKIYKGGK